MHHTPPLIIEQLRCAAPDGRVILDIDRLVVKAGERVAIVGPNGAGKSTLLRCVGGFAKPVSGHIKVLGQSLVPKPKASELRLLRANLGQVLQGLHLVQRLTALDNVLIGALGRSKGWGRWALGHRPEDIQQALAALEAAGLQGRDQERVDRLSGGERQKVSIARMLMQKPRLILADEPTASLDPAAAHDICKLLVRGARQATLITVVHNAELLPLLAERVVGLRQGRLAFDVPLAEVTPALLQALYEAPSAASAYKTGPTPEAIRAPLDHDGFGAASPVTSAP
jgi:phosphonate transport system ATP-binding protein